MSEITDPHVTHLLAIAENAADPQSATAAATAALVHQTALLTEQVRISNLIAYRGQVPKRCELQETLALLIEEGVGL